MSNKDIVEIIIKKYLKFSITNVVTMVSDCAIFCVYSGSREKYPKKSHFFFSNESKEP